MNQLINTFEENDRILVSGRELHALLDINTRYNDWFERMKLYGFVDGQDYKAITQKRVTAQGNGTTYTDHHITIDMGKEISMLQRNEKGKRARQYFLDLERKWNSPEMILKRAQDYLNEQVRLLTEENKQLKPKAFFAEAVTASHTSILVGDLAKLLRQNGIEIGQNRLFAWLRENGYLINRKGDSWNMPTQKSMDQELFMIKESTHHNSDGSVRISKTTKVTGKGQVYFINKILNTKEVI